jgi:hypothetical protein
MYSHGKKGKTKMSSGIITLFVFLMLCFLVIIGCKNPASGSGDSGGANDTEDDITDVTEETDVTDDNGVTDEIDVTVEAGVILITVNENGAIEIDGDNIDLVEFSGIWTLIDGISIFLEDNEGNLVGGTISVNPDTGLITFTPSTPLDPGAIYTLNVNVLGTCYTATVLIAVDVMEEDSGESVFADVELRDLGTYAVQDLIVGGKAILGWEFGANPFRIRIHMINIEPGAKVLLTAYGVYNIEGHLDEVYYQRWVYSGNPVEDYQWKDDNYKTYTGTIWVDEQDSTLDGPGGEPDYSFWSSYFEIKIIKEGADITAASAAQLIIE